MQSLRELYKIGRGPSSSHTIGPERAAKLMKNRHTDADKFIVTLYGSLALSGKGHCTDEVPRKTFAPAPCEVIFDKTSPCPVHPNTLDIRAERGGKELATTRFYSVGGGTIRIEGEPGANTGIDEGVILLVLTTIFRRTAKAKIYACGSTCRNAKATAYSAISAIYGSR